MKKGNYSYGWQLRTDINNSPFAKILATEGNLTQHLKNLQPNHRFVLKNQDLSFLKPEEMTYLKSSSDRGLIRQVLHYFEEKPIVYARTLIPQILYERHKEKLDTLGNQPIGQAMLYIDAIKRSSFEYGQIEMPSFLFEAVKTFVPQIYKQNELWARRSTFFYPEAPLSITEIFLPDLIPYVS